MGMTTKVIGAQLLRFLSEDVWPNSWYIEGGIPAEEIDPGKKYAVRELGELLSDAGESTPSLTTVYRKWEQRQTHTLIQLAVPKDCLVEFLENLPPGVYSVSGK